jgi:phosphatidylinositol alpha-1,6-mannosyltransferase
MSAAPLFVTRKFPPSVGGMETLSEMVWDALQQAEQGSRLIAYGGANDLRLLLWFGLTPFRVAARLARGDVSVVVVGDALTYAVLAPVLLVSRVRHLTLVMGLDLTYPHVLYRASVLPLLRRAQRVLAISSATAEQAKAVGVPAERIRIFRLGVPGAPPSAPSHAAANAQVVARWALPTDARLVLTLGRLVRRKGARWFVTEVLPGLPDDVHYLLAGRGPEQDAIEQAAQVAGVGSRVHLLGRVTDEERELLLHGSHLFVQPNISVPGDMEGFGLVTIEAALRGLPVAAADLEGIKDAVLPDVTGFLLPGGDAAAWTDKVAELLSDTASLARVGETFQVRAQEVYSDEAMAASLIDALAPVPDAVGT